MGGDLLSIRTHIKETMQGNINLFSYASKAWIMSCFHVHDDFEIYFCMQNDVKFIMPDKVYRLQKGDIIIFNNTDIHMSVIPPEVEYNRKILGFKPEYITPFSTSTSDLLDCFLNRKPDFSHKVHLCEKKVNEFLSIFNKIEYYHNQTFSKDNIKYGFDIYLRIYVIELLLLINKEYRKSDLTYTNDSDNYYSKLKPILHYIHNYFYLEITLEELSKKFFFSQTYIIFLFKKVTGYTPNHYIVKWRIAKACELLKKERYNVTQVAEKAGFQSTSYFIRTFRQIVGQTPGQYLKDSREYPVSNDKNSAL